MSVLPAKSLARQFLVPPIPRGVGPTRSQGGGGPQILLSATSVLESASVGTAIGTLSVSGGTGTPDFSITADPDSKFALNVDGETLETGAALDYETKTSHAVTIYDATNDISRAFTIHVTNVVDVVPDQFGTGDWSVADAGTGGEITLTISSLPTAVDGISDIEYQIDAGSWVSLSSATTGAHTVGSMTDGTEYAFAVRAVNAAGNGTASATKAVTPTAVPDAMAAGDWSVASEGTGTIVTVTIISLPADNGAAISDIEYRVDGGSWVSSGVSTTTTFDITGLTQDIEISVELRAVNATGAASVSDLKAVTPVVGGSLSDVLSLLAAGTAAAWWTPQSGAIFKEAPGAVESTTAGDAIAINLDTYFSGESSFSTAMAAQAELMTNGDMSSSTGWILDSPYSISAGKMTKVSGSGRAAQTPSLSATLYLSSYDLDAVSGGSWKVYTRGGTQVSGAENSSTGTKTDFIIENGTNTEVAYNVSVIGVTAQMDNASFKEVAGYPAFQASSALQPKLQSGPVARFDGADDYWSQLLALAATGTIIAVLNKSSAPGSTQVIFGASGSSTDYGYLGIDSSGHAVARLGTSAAFAGTISAVGSKKALSLAYGSAAADLYVDSAADVSAQAYSGNPTSSILPIIGSANLNGTPSAPIGADLSHLIYVAGYKASAAEIAAVTSYLLNN